MTLSVADELGVVTALTELWFDVDHRGGAGVAQLFVADGKLTFDRASFTGREEIRRVYADRAAAGTRLSRHVLSNVRIQADGADQVRVYSLMTLYADDAAPPSASVTPVAVADVNDVLVREGSRWLFSSRDLQTIFRDPGARLAVPTE